MKLVSILAVRDEADVLDAHLGFHLNAGVDLVIATDFGSQDETAEILESYTRGGYVSRIAEPVAAGEAQWRTSMARLAATEHNADWVLSTDADEFWWPRGENLKDVLVAMPPRYGVVQGLVRVFPPRRDDELFAERMTFRPSLIESADAVEPVARALRPAYRADPRLVIDSADPTQGGTRVPLRAWYPIEVLRFPFRSVQQAERRLERAPTPRSQLEAEAADAFRQGRLAEWYEGRAGADLPLVRDERLRNALRVLRRPDSAGDRRRFVLPSETAEPLALEVPDVVDDASYAGECAAVREVDFEPLVERIAELEARIASLETRFWPRVRRTASRLVRR